MMLRSSRAVTLFGMFNTQIRFIKLERSENKLSRNNLIISAILTYARLNVEHGSEI